jgi:hypothetical protein
MWQQMEVLLIDSVRPFYSSSSALWNAQRSLCVAIPPHFITLERTSFEVFITLLLPQEGKHNAQQIKQ